MKVAFDVDDTLIIPNVVTGGAADVPNFDTINLYRWFQAQGCHMIVWSGGGEDYARMWAEKLGLFPDEVRHKRQCDDVDIAFDDCDVNLGKVNVKVKRLDNSISRKEWNEHRKV